MYANNNNNANDKQKNVHLTTLNENIINLNIQYSFTLFANNHCRPLWSRLTSCCFCLLAKTKKNRFFVFGERVDLLLEFASQKDMKNYVPRQNQQMVKKWKGRKGRKSFILVLPFISYPIFHLMGENTEHDIEKRTI